MLLDETHESFRSSVRALAAKHVAPIADEVAIKDEFPDHLRPVFAGADLIQLSIPEEYGGPGADILAHCIAREELAASGSLVLAQLAGQNTSFARPVIQHGSAELRSRLLPRLATGSLLTCIAISEPDVGSDPAEMRTRAKRDGDIWVLNGSKQYIGWASIADYALVFARTNDQPRARGISAFVVDTKDPGWQIIRTNDKMGQHGVPNCDVALDDVRVPAENMVGEEGRGFIAAMGALGQNRPTVAALGVGLAQGAYDYARTFAEQRTIGGTPISTFQGLRWKFADMATSIEAARNLVYSAAQAWDSGAPAAECNKLSSMAKLYASEVAQRVSSEAVQILGGAGYMADHPVERYARDAQALTVVEGTSEIQRNIIAKAVLG